MDSHAETKRATQTPDLPQHATNVTPSHSKSSFYGCLVVCAGLLLPLVFGDLLIMSLFESTLSDGITVVLALGYLLFWLACLGIYCYASWRLIILSQTFSGSGRTSARGTAMVLAILPWLLLLLAVGLASIWKAERESKSPTAGSKYMGVSVTGLDHLPDHLSVQYFNINDVGNYQAGNGGGNVCCTYIPHAWHEGLTAKVTWYVTNWRECTGESHEATVPVTRYDHYPGHVYMHFLADGSIRVVPTNKTYLETDYSGPRDPIPDKEPRKVWPPMQHCPQNFTNLDLNYNM